MEYKKISTQPQNQYLDFLMNPSFQGVNRLFVLSCIEMIEHHIQIIIFQK